ncbi:MAG: small multi-drug export protein [Thermoplasmata archaeon]
MAWWTGITDFLEWLPPWFVVIFISIIPFIELRGAIPVAIFMYDMPWWEAFPLAVVGNMIPVPIILNNLGNVESWLRRWKRWDRFFTKLYSKTRARADAKIKRYEAIGVMSFVAIPLPFTGAWTGSLIAYLFDIKFKRALLIVLAGVCIAGVIVTLLCLFAKGFIWPG